MEMECRRWRKLLNRYVDGELDGRGRLKVDEHLKLCGRCQGYIRYLETTKRVFKAKRVESPRPYFWTRLAPRLEERGTSWHELEVAMKRLTLVGSMVALIIMASLTSLYLRGEVLSLDEFLLKNGFSPEVRAVMSGDEVGFGLLMGTTLSSQEEGR